MDVGTLAKVPITLSNLIPRAILKMFPLFRLPLIEKRCAGREVVTLSSLSVVCFSEELRLGWLMGSWVQLWFFMSHLLVSVNYAYFAYWEIEIAEKAKWNIFLLLCEILTWRPWDLRKATNFVVPWPLNLQNQIRWC